MVIRKVVVGWLTTENKTENKSIYYENDYLRMITKTYNIITDIYREKHTSELNYEKIYKTIKAIFYYLILIIIELTNYSFYFIVFLSCLSYLVSMEKRYCRLWYSLFTDRRSKYQNNHS